MQFTISKVPTQEEANKLNTVWLNKYDYERFGSHYAMLENSIVNVSSSLQVKRGFVGINATTRHAKNLNLDEQVTLF